MGLLLDLVTTHSAWLRTTLNVCGLYFSIYHTQTAPTLHLAYSTLFSGPLFSDQIYPVVCTGFVFILSLVAWIYLVLVHNFSLWKFFLKTPKYHSILLHYHANLFNIFFSDLIYVDYPLWEFYFVPLCFWYDVLFKATEYPLWGYLFYPTVWDKTKII